VGWLPENLFARSQTGWADLPPPYAEKLTVMAGAQDTGLSRPRSRP